MEHTPVLLVEVSDYLKPEPNKRFIDGTVGLGGHAATLLSQALPGGRLLGIDRDATNLERAKLRLTEFKESVVLVCDSYANMRAQADAHGFTSVDGILLDLGFSSVHVDDPQRGFSFQSDGPLDMRYDLSQALTAQEIVNTWTEDELARIFRVYGEELQARRFAQAIVQARTLEPLVRTKELAELIARTSSHRGKIHPATQVFQALRIAVNDELGTLERVLPDCVDLLVSGGRLVIISFHSLEDRLVKQFFKTMSSLEVLTKRPVVPTTRSRG